MCAAPSCMGLVGNRKSKASKRPVPLDPLLAQVLWKWRATTTYNKLDDWVFASPKTKGEKPYRPGMPIRWHLRPAAQLAGIESRIGRHTFRRTIATLLNRKRGGRKDRAGVHATREQQNHARPIRTSRHLGQAYGTEQSCSDVAFRANWYSERRKQKPGFLNKPFQTLDLRTRNH